MADFMARQRAAKVKAEAEKVRKAANSEKWSDAEARSQEQRAAMEAVAAQEAAARIERAQARSLARLYAARSEDDAVFGIASEIVRLETIIADQAARLDALETKNRKTR